MEEDQEAHFQSPSEKAHHDDHNQINNPVDDQIQGSLANWDGTNTSTNTEINNKSNGNTKKGDEGSRKRLCIKFKVTNICNNENDANVCNICDKTFGSGKALGGHMRVHSLSAKKVVHEAKNNNTDLDSVNCDLCKRFFPSKKSLFGHMKSHPERVLRGIQPPKGPNPTFDSTPLKGWSVTAKRGRRSLSSSCCNKTGSEPLEHDDIMQDMQELEAVNDLLFLANWNPETLPEYEEEKSKISGDRVEFSSPSVSLIRKLKIEEKSSSFEEDRSLSGSQVFYGSSVDDRDMSKVKKSINKKKKGTKKMKLSEVGIAERCNKCSICNKSFSNYQALGGHLRSHRKSKNIQIVKNESGSDDVSAATEEKTERRTTMQVDETDTVVVDTNGVWQQCNVVICSKNFSTGQVLEGHKRSHWTIMTESQSAQEIQTVENGKNCAKILSFDLNQLPDMDEEEGVQSDLIILADITTSSSYASSSQNSVTHQ